MSSSNRVRLAFIEEIVYGTTPASGNFSTARFTSESLSGSPETTSSEQIRTDRLASGQVATGLTVGGDLNFELAKESQLEALFESAFLNTWQTSSAVTVDLTIDATLNTITRASGDFNSDVEVGDIIELSGFSTSGNNTECQVASIDSSTVITVVFPAGVADETGTGTEFQVADKLQIGTTEKSFSIEKAFTDLSNKGINYTGMLVNTMSLNVAYGELATGTLGFVGNGYDPVNAASDFMTDGRTIDASATTDTMNASIDVPWIANDLSGSFIDSTFCIQSLSMDLTNNYRPQTCVGSLAPENNTPGQADVSLTLDAYNADENFELLERKLTQTSIAIGFQIKNADGYYGVYIPAAQVSLDDPSSPGQNQDIIVSATGAAKVGANGENQLVLFRSAS